MSTEQLSYTEFQEQYTRERIASIAARLRRMADDIEREAAEALTLDSAVSMTIHTVQWGVANLSLNILVDNLGRYHHAVRSDEKKGRADEH